MNLPITVPMNNETGVWNGPRSLLQSRRILDTIKRAFPDAKITFNQGHYYCSCFVKQDDKIAYLLTSDYRYFPGQFLVRTATGALDYIGGRNHNYKHFENIVSALRKILK